MAEPTIKKRLGKHLLDRSDIRSPHPSWERYDEATDKYVLKPDSPTEPWYRRSNWMHDLHSKGLRPTMEILREVEIAPMAIEWETRYILHGIQQGWSLTNSESAAEDLFARARVSQLDFLRCSFESLVHERFISKKGIEAFAREFYRP